MENFYVNIGHSNLYKKLDVLPDSENKLSTFILMHNGCSNFLEKINTICGNKNMTILQLDSLFILARYVHYHYAIIKKKIFNFIKDNFAIFNGCPVKFDDLYDSDNIIFFEYIVQYIVENLLDSPNFYKFKNDILEKIKSDFQIVISNNIKGKILNYFLNVKNNTYIEKFFSEFYKYYISETKNIIIIVNKVLEICSKNIICDNDKLFLQIFIDNNLNLVPNFQTDIIIQDYYMYVEDIEDEKNDNNLREEDINFNKIEIYSENKSHVDNINQKLSSCGMKLENNKTNLWMHSILDCFIGKQLFSSKDDAINLIIYVFIVEKDTIGYINKYDISTLFDCYSMVAIANGINITYQEMIAYLQLRKRMPIEYPIEIILRIFSRILEIKIILYTSNLTKIEIDNSLEPCKKEISIYQHSIDHYYNIIPISNENINEELYNDINDIVEI